MHFIFLHSQFVSLIMSYCRTVEDVQNVIQHAKLSDDELHPLTQVLSFAPKIEVQEKYKFLELDSTLLNNLQNGQSLVFRGTKDENAVLCTNKQTYDVKEAETSNSLLLLPDLRWPAQQTVAETGRMLEEKQVLGVFHKYYELRICKPKLRKVHQLLEKCLYRGPEYEDDIVKTGVKLYTFQDLLDNVQASKLELKAELKENMAFCINGEPLYRLLEARVCRFLAEVLLRQAGKFNLEEFLLSWQQSVPEGMQTSEKYLEGMALMDKNSKPEVIWYFSEADLPEDINERIRILFQTREKWTLDEIRPYVQRLATEKVNVNALLTKYARASSVGGVRYYSAKHAK
ncbi:sister chromatid cohesion protein DCC1 isoform X4 [Zootermopsis nevadensis]|uniref:sister chromatid cohesion protein DCC1 isoform X4 n=1 Tax=Zootermopsis nevadensis TaxID=136037 RepID=UPI000B8EBAB2|nr:sister chromatid cohesion protein DCC1 isoform X4 [Zootermopsis nevadensis]